MMWVAMWRGQGRLWWFCLLLQLTLIAKADVVRFPGGADPTDKRWEYPIAVLQLALNKTSPIPGADQIVRGEARIQRRRILETESGQLDVGLAIPSPDLLASKAIFIPFPIQKGLQGWRLILANNEVQGQLDRASTLHDLKTLRMGYNPGWGDWPVMLRAGLPVVEMREYSTMFNALSIGRFDWIPRGLSEVYGELNRARQQGVRNISVNTRLALFFPSDFFFIVTPSKPELAKRIEHGLKLARESGEFDKLFEQHFGEIINQSELDKRTLILIDNPYLPNSVPTSDNKLWMLPQHTAP
ncbi:hypothetical protein [Chitinivorax sp. B]|uniref:hypothetical protein n=1 Tax=Chitinivorax sp. B TaxID=2502235 RepID=UPI0010F4EB30|nr:hypothetical protein [Chitinivorax sp. B]